MTTPAATNLNLSSQKSMTDPFSTSSFEVNGRFLALTHLSQRRKFTAMSNPSPLTHEALDDLSNKLQLLFDALKTHFGVAPPPLEMPQKAASAARLARMETALAKAALTTQLSAQSDPRSTAASPLTSVTIETPSGTTTFAPGWNSAPDEAPEPVTTADTEVDELGSGYPEELKGSCGLEAEDQSYLASQFFADTSADILAYLSEPRLMTQILAEISASESVVRDAIGVMVKDGRVVKSGRSKGTRYQAAKVSE